MKQNKPIIKPEEKLEKETKKIKRKKNNQLKKNQRPSKMSQ